MKEESIDEPVDVSEELEEDLETEDRQEEKLESEVFEPEEAEADEPEEEEFVEPRKTTRAAEKRFDEEDIVEERFYTIPLRKVWISPRKKRAPKAARVVRRFVVKHMKLQTETEPEVDLEEEAERLVIDNEVNEKLWSRGIEKPPRKIKVRVVKNTEGVVTVLLAEGD
jgi:large subunit ribosomal protein L31e